MRGHNLSNALEIVENEMPDTEIRRQILDFIKNQKEGIIKGI